MEDLIQELQRKEEQRKEQIKKAVSKFKPLKTNVKNEFWLKIDERIKHLDLNVSAYLQRLIKNDLEDALSQSIHKSNESEVKRLNEQIDALNAKYEEMGIIEFILKKWQKK